MKTSAKVTNIDTIEEFNNSSAYLHFGNSGITIRTLVEPDMYGTQLSLNITGGSHGHSMVGVNAHVSPEFLKKIGAWLIEQGEKAEHLWTGKHYIDSELSIKSSNPELALDSMNFNGNCSKCG